MKKICIMIMVLVVTLAACKKTPEVNLKYVDVEREIVTVGTTTANIQCDYKYIATLKKAYLFYGEGEAGLNMTSAEMRVVQNTLYVELSGLKGNTTYGYYYEFHNGFNSMRTALKSFKTENGNGGGEEPPTPEITLPTVITALVTGITSNSAQCGGEVTNDGGVEVTERGICWSTNANPTLINSHVAVGTGIGAFTATVSGLNESITYHVRAYAINEKGTAYGLDVEFTTLSSGGIAQLPVVITSEMTGITAHSASCGGEVTSDGGAEVTERGICWSTNVNPTISNSHAPAGTGTGTFSVTMTGLQAFTTYHVRAYATNEIGTAYGEDKEFTTLSGGGNEHEGALSGLFSIAEDDRWVRFSKGNLQYQASTNTWRFAENQWDYVGGTDVDTWTGGDFGNVYENGAKCSNNEISPTYSGWIDLFGWATSGWNNNNHYYQPWDSESTGWVLDGYGYGYWDGEYSDCSMTGEWANMDWGVYNAISNGGNEPGLWRNGANDIYRIVHFRENAPYLQSKGKVNDVPGLILLPDAWVLPDGVTFLGSSYNIYNLEEWEIMENAGAVFIPNAGERYGTTYHSSVCRYWDVRGSINGTAGCFEGNDSFQQYRFCGCSVRLVQDVNP